LIEKKWIASVKSEELTRKKEYQITDLGKSILESEIIRLEELLENGRKLLGGYSR